MLRVLPTDSVYRLRGKYVVRLFFFCKCQGRKLLKPQDWDYRLSTLDVPAFLHLINTRISKSA